MPSESSLGSDAGDGGSQDREATLEQPTRQQIEVCRMFATIATTVPIDQWCVIGGMMTEFVLLERGRTTLRPTTDGDVVGDVFGHAKVLRGLAKCLTDHDYEPVASGWDAEFGTRFKHRLTGTFIDVLAPANSARRRDITTLKGRRALEAPGTDVALETASPMRIRFGVGEVLRVSAPTLAGALYAKVSAYQRMAEHDNQLKHLQDAAQLLVAANVHDFAEPNPAMMKRLRWLEYALNSDHRGWVGLDRTDQQDAMARLRRILTVA